VQRCTKKSSQFQAVKYVQAKTICSDAPKNLASFKQYFMFKQKPCAAMHQKSSQFQAIRYVQAKTMCRDAPKNLASFKQYSMFKQKRCAAMQQKI